MDFNTVTFKIKNIRKAKLPIDLVTRYNNHVGELRDKDLDHLMIVCEIPSDADDNTIRNELITALEEEIATNMALPEMVEHMRDIMIKKQEINDYRQITYGKNIYSYMFQTMVRNLTIVQLMCGQKFTADRKENIGGLIICTACRNVLDTKCLWRKNEI